MGCRSKRAEGTPGGEAGSALVEFALSGLLLLSVLLGIVECSRALYLDHFVASAAREATRYAAVRGASAGVDCSSTTVYGCTAASSDVTAFVHSIATAGVQSSNLAVTTTWPGTDATGASCVASGQGKAAGCLVVVTVGYTFSYLVPFLPAKPVALSSTSKVTIVE